MKTFARQGRVRIGTVVFAAALLAAGRGASAREVNGSLYAHVEQFVWEEFNDDGTRLLEESGPLFGFGGTLGGRLSPRWRAFGLGELFFGEVDYDGATIDGRPVKSETEYTGTKLEAGMSLALAPDAAVSIEPLAGIGLRGWLRDLQDVSAEIRGYEERWLAIYAMLGAHLAATTSGGSLWTADLGVRLPLDNRAEYDFSNLGADVTVTVEPGGDTAFYAEAGWAKDRFTVSAFFEQLRFDKSNVAVIGGELLIWQPESQADIAGLRAGITF